MASNPKRNLKEEEKIGREIKAKVDKELLEKQRKREQNGKK